MKKSYFSSKIFESIIAFVVIPIAYFLFWSGFEYIQKPVILAKSAVKENFVPDFVNLVRNTGTDYSIYGIDRKTFETVTESMISGGNKVKEPGKDIEILEKICSGSRFIIEPVENAKGYYFNQISGSVENDNGENTIHVCPNVVKCPEGNALPRIICENISNEKNGKSVFSESLSDQSVSNLFLKPIIKIRKSDFDIFDERPVIGMLLKNAENNSFDTIVIRVRDFSDRYKGEYDGQYKEEFFSPELVNNTEVPFEKVFIENENRTVELSDIKIFWFGQVEVWLDKLIIDDYMADKLFNSEDHGIGTFDQRISESSTPENLEYLLKSVKNKKEISISNQNCLNYVINKMYNSLMTDQYAQTR